jgi:hypothetical protein
MKNKQTKKTSAVDAMKQAKGRFFGLYLKNGEVINAQFRRETPQKVSIYDRKNGRERLINKSGIDFVYTNSTGYAA